MQREDLAQELAREASLPEGVARDEIDKLVHRIVTRLRRGQRVELPGLGKLIPKPFARTGRR